MSDPALARCEEKIKRSGGIIKTMKGGDPGNCEGHHVSEEFSSNHKYQPRDRSLSSYDEEQESKFI